MLSKNNIKIINSLPIYNYLNEIKSMISNNNIILIMGETGSGKTTQIPKIIYNNLNLNNKIICITQPRRVAAISISMRVAEELNSKIGGLVGYSVRFKEKISKHTKIKFVTHGMLVRECKIDKLLSKYSYIILDEIHERAVQTDMLLTICKDLILNKKRNDLKLIIMSATVNPNKFLNYFEITDIKNHLIKIEGRNFPVNIYNITKEYNPIKTIETNSTIISNYIDLSLSCIMQILLSKEEDFKYGDILVFLPGQEDIENLEELLISKKTLLSTKYPNLKIFYEILTLYSSVPYHEQMKIFLPLPRTKNGNYIRKIILSTNIAETSLTIKNIKFIVDSGYCKIRKYYHKWNIDTLLISQISKNSAIQRAGRAGRESEGKCFRLYTEEKYNNFKENTEPEILRINLRNVLLDFLSIGLFKNNIFDIDFIDKPPKENYQSAIEDLISLKAIKKYDYSLTDLGKKMSILPLEPIYAIILINALDSEYEMVFNDIVIIIALLQSDNIFYTPSNQKEKIDKIREKFINPISDHLTLLNIYYNFKESKNKINFCKENFFNERALNKAEDIKIQLLEYLKKIKMNEYKNNKDLITKESIEKFDNYLNFIENEKKNFYEQDNEKIKKQELIIKCLLTGYCHNLARFENDNIYTSIKGNITCKIHPTSFLIKKFKIGREYKYLFFDEMIITSKKYLKCNTFVKEESILKYIINKNI